MNSLLSYHVSKKVSEGRCGAQDRGDGDGDEYFGTRAIGIAARLGATTPRSVDRFRCSENSGTPS